jgi:hypothetical protein
MESELSLEACMEGRKEDVPEVAEEGDEGGQEAENKVVVVDVANGPLASGWTASGEVYAPKTAKKKDEKLERLKKKAPMSIPLVIIVPQPFQFH